MGKSIRCECGAIMGERCQAEKGATVRVLWVPDHLRGTSRAAGGDMIRPYADVLRLHPDCYRLLRESEGDWMERF